jgi:hypothetical protein
MRQTVYEAKAARAWRLAHEERRPMKRVASALGVTISEAYELLAYFKARQEAVVRREMALGRPLTSNPELGAANSRMRTVRSAARRDRDRLAGPASDQWVGEGGKGGRG